MNTARREYGAKTWMRRRAGETDAQRADRLAHSCYRCGWYSEDPQALARHEDSAHE
jgi:hypothetical protein